MQPPGSADEPLLESSPARQVPVTTENDSELDTQEPLEEKSYCSKCNAFVLSSQFDSDKNNKRRKTCRKHTKKRAAEPDSTTWEEFCASIEAWEDFVSYCR